MRALGSGPLGTPGARVLLLTSEAMRVDRVRALREAHAFLHLCDDLGDRSVLARHSSGVLAVEPPTVETTSGTTRRRRVTVAEGRPAAVGAGARFPDEHVTRAVVIPQEMRFGARALDELRAFYEPHNRMLEELIGRPMLEWRSSSDGGGSGDSAAEREGRGEGDARRRRRRR
jgi:hypothetical protein